MFLLTLNSCKKSAPIITDNTPATQQVKDYLTQKSTQLTTSTSRTTTTDYYADLLGNLNFAQLTTLQNPKANETIYIVPLINDNNPNGTAVAVFYKYTNIEEADIVTVANGKESTSDFKNVLTYDLNNFTGKIETKDVKGNVTSVAEMVNGKIIKRDALEARMALPVGDDLPCTDYYYVQYYTNAAGDEVIVSSTYLYTLCPNSGGGGSPAEPEEDKSEDVSWIVKTGSLTTFITYEIKAHETLTGTKNKFKSATVVGVGMQLDGNPSGLGYIHTVQNHAITGGGAGYNYTNINAQGNIKGNGETLATYNNNNTWYSNGVF